MIAPLEPPVGYEQAASQVGSLAGDSLASQVDRSHWGRGQWVAMQRRVSELTARNPVAAVAVAAVIGLALGWVSKRRTP